MTSIDLIKSKILKLYKTNPNIYISVATTHPKLNLNKEPAVIKGVYSHVFQIDEQSSGTPQSHTFQYTDILTKHIEIAELGKFKRL